MARFWNNAKNCVYVSISGGVFVSFHKVSIISDQSKQVATLFISQTVTQSEHVFFDLGLSCFIAFLERGVLNSDYEVGNLFEFHMSFLIHFFSHGFLLLDKSFALLKCLVKLSHIHMLDFWELYCFNNSRFSNLCFRKRFILLC
jgi:hypothetical protein